MGVQMFAGKFQSCNIITEAGLVPVSPDVVPNVYVCKSMNDSFTWHNPQVNFDNVLMGYLALFQVVSDARHSFSLSVTLSVVNDVLSFPLCRLPLQATFK